MTEKLSGAWNFRDVASSTSGAIRPGRLFRSGELTQLDETGARQLEQLWIRDVADLRSTPEVRRHGADRVPASVRVHALPFVEVLTGDKMPDDDVAPHEHAFARLMKEHPDPEAAAAKARRFMAEEYLRFATADGAQRALRETARLLAAGSAVLTHCFAGKDRTGFSVAVVLDAVGVDRSAVMDDYLASNYAAPELREQITGRIRAQFGGELPSDAATYAQARLSDDVLGVRPEYLEGALARIEADFGSVRGYLRAAGVSDDELASLRSTLLA